MTNLPRWIQGLDDEDFNFLKRFVMASGSLKQLAFEYEVSYPTVRLRLDRLIAKVEVWDAATSWTPFERQLRSLFADGKINEVTFRKLLDSYKKEIAT